MRKQNKVLIEDKIGNLAKRLDAVKLETNNISELRWNL